MPFPQRCRLRTLLLTAPLTAVLLGACGGSTPQASATPTPLSIAEIQTRYTTAANQYNHSMATIGLTENAACDVGSATATLSACQAAVSQQRQATIAYDNALRATLFTGTAATDANHLLSDDAAIEAMLEQEATAPSIAAVASVQTQVIPLLATATKAATTLRTDIGLPPAPV